MREGKAVGGQPYLDCTLGEAGQVEAVEQLLVCQGTALHLHFIGTDNRSLPLKHKVAITGPYELRSPLCLRRVWILQTIK